MATYTYRCPVCGEFDLALPMGSAQRTAQCHNCNQTSNRVFSGPALHGGATTLRRVRELGEASSSEPMVTRHVPEAALSRPAATTNARHALLPRP